MRSMFAVLTCGILVLIATAGCNTSPRAKRDKFLKSGKAHLEQKEYERAVLDLRNAAAAAPRDAECFYQLGLAYIGLRDVRDAWSSFKTSVTLDPKHQGAILNLSLIQASSPDSDMVRQAKTDLSELLREHPGDPTALNALALSELKLGEVGNGERHLQQALAASPQSLVNFTMLAQSKLMQNDRAGAEQVLDQACKMNPQSVDARLLMAQFQLAMNRIPNAEKELRAAVAINANHPAALLLLGKLLLATGRKPEAEDLFRRLSTASDASARPVYALYLFGEGRKDEAVKEFERLANADRSDRGARSRLVAAYWQTGKAREAEAVLNQALKSNSSDREALLQRADLYLALGRRNDSQADIYEAIRQEPNSVRAHYKLAALHRAQRNTESERQELFEVLRLEPTNLQARIELARSFAGPAAARTALDLLSQAPPFQRDLPVVIAERNWALWALGDIPEMRKGVESGLSRQRTADLLIQRALLEMRDNHHAAARTTLNEAMQIDPMNLRAVDELRRSYVSQNQQSEAVKKVQEYAAGYPRSAQVQTFLGTVLTQSGDKAKARAAFEAAVAADSSFEPARMALVQLDFGEGRKDEAAARLESLLAMNKSNTLARSWLANIEVSRGHHDKAIGLLERVVEAEPNQAQALNNLAYLLLERTNRTDEALKYAQKARELAPDNPNFADTLGWALFRKGLYTMAAQQLERVAFRKDADPVSRFHLAMAYAKAGESKKGQAVLQAALSQHPNLPEAKMAKEVVEASNR